MSPLLWNVAIVWSACAVFGVEYCVNLVERDKQREPIAQRRKLPPKMGRDD